MEEIIKKANELGLMIKGTDVSMRFEELAKTLNNETESKSLLEEYIKLMQEYQEKESAGAPIEVEEKNKLKEMSEKISKNELLKEYIATQSYLINMMMQIQQAISEPKGDPIRPSKIVTPGSSGKIITGV
ncbi:MAG: YlbF family regulator [Spirochaetes bacterium]|nr:YlbF family regulator [Spirochaetota bacterium]